MTSNEKFIEKFCDCYKRKIEDIIELEKEEEEEEKEDSYDQKRTLTLLLSEILRMEEYCEDSKVFEQTFQELQDKVEAILYVLDELEKRSEMIAEKIDNLKKTKEKVDKKYEGLMNYLSESLRGAHFQKFATENHNLSFRKSESINMLEDIDSDKLVDPDYAGYIKQRTDFSWDKIKIKEDLKNGLLSDKMKHLVGVQTKFNLNYKDRTK